MCEAKNAPDVPEHEMMRTVADVLAVMSIDEIRDLVREIEEIISRDL